MRDDAMGAAIIGCGDVANDRYLPYLSGSPYVRVLSCADLDSDRARRTAARFGIRAASMRGVLDDPAVEMVLDLTPPLAHVQVNEAGLRARKHVYSEKPLAPSVDEARRLVQLAEQAGRRIASAPDTILGPNIGLARRLIDEGRIGRPLMASMSFVTADRGWHPDADFFYREGAGPIFDEGPYFLSALVYLLGPVREAFARSARYHDELAIGTGSRAGERFKVEVPTSYAGGLVLRSGVLVSFLLSFDVRGSTMPPLEIYGEEGTLRLGFPGYYNGPVRVGREHDAITEEIQPVWETAMEDARGIGVEEFARAIRTGGPSRLEGAPVIHVLEAMEAIVAAARTGEHVTLASTTERPAPYDPADNARNLPARKERPS